ncbi:polyribonucleotide nucleotidyltransferase [candidate division KSB1 bacterium]
MTIKKTITLSGRELSIETGRIARQAAGSVIVQYGDTVVLVAVTTSHDFRGDQDFVPLTVDYREKAYASGKIPGGFFKREGRPTDKETLSARLIDRPIRALFNKEFKYETMVMVAVLSSDQENDSDILGIIGASAAMSLSEVPFDTAISAVRVGMIGDEVIVNPTFEQLETSRMNVIVAGSMDSIVMVEGEAAEVSNAEVMKAFETAHEHIRQAIPMIEEIAKEAGKEKREAPTPDIDEELIAKVRKIAEPLMDEALALKEKHPRHEAIRAIKIRVLEKLLEEYPDNERLMKNTVTDIEGEKLRDMIVTKSQRVDGRDLRDVRQITCELSVLPRTHGSALFTRGETQSLAVATLGTKLDEQKIEALDGQSFKRYMLHYNFPPYSVGEVKRIMGPGRREIGHGRLAEKALEYGMPSEDEFPYTVRVVSEITESNGSSSMASVCAGSLALMDAGVPVKKQTAGIAMGLIMEGDKSIVLSDILGDEDHLGDMDFKVAGSAEGITSIQMDIKVKGLPITLIAEVLEQAREGVDHILGVMNEVISEPREKLSPYAPSIIHMKVPVEEIGTVIGPGGKMIREIQERTESIIHIDDEGTVLISAVATEKGEEARAFIESLVEAPEPGKIYEGTIKKITNFGAFVEILPGKEGLLHISEISHQRVEKVEDVLSLGQKVRVRLRKLEANGKMDLTHKNADTTEHDEESMRRGDDRKNRRPRR